MNKRVGLIVIVIILVFSIFILNASGIFTKTTHCGVSFDDAVYEFKDSSGNSIFVIDEGGNLYLNASGVNLGVTGADPSDGFSIKSGSSWYWTFSNTLAEVKGDILEGETLPTTIGLDMVMFRNPVDETPLVLFNVSSGNILVKGMAVYYDAQANCSADFYTDVSTDRVYQDNYCDKSACTSKNIDLDDNESLCLGEFSGWQLGGEDQGDCCGNNESEEVLERVCADGCSSLDTDKSCCNDTLNCVYGGECTDSGETVCAPWGNDDILGTCNSNSWSEGNNCTNECDNICSAYSGCTSGSCSGTSDCVNNETCSAGSGCTVTPACDSTFECSLGEYTNTYDVLGNFSCQSGCDGSGGCNYTIDCIDCNVAGIGGDLCACSCNDHNQTEEMIAGNCGDGIDNDCDGDIDDADSGCCTDADADGYYDKADCGTPVDCDDDPVTGPGIYQYLTCYTDGDGDGQGTGSSSQLCSGASCPSGYSSNNDDCCDSDSRAYDGSNTYDSSQTSCGDWDYDCDGYESEASNCYACSSCTISSTDCGEGCDAKAAITASGCSGISCGETIKSCTYRYYLNSCGNQYSSNVYSNGVQQSRCGVSGKGYTDAYISNQGSCECN